jgi:hypothetical protein
VDGADGLGPAYPRLAPDMHTPVTCGDRILGIVNGKVHCVAARDLAPVWTMFDRSLAGHVSLIASADRAPAFTEKGPSGMFVGPFTERPGLPVPREPAYADKRSKDCGVLSASERAEDRMSAANVRRRGMGTPDPRKTLMGHNHLGVIKVLVQPQWHVHKHCPAAAASRFAKS